MSKPSTTNLLARHSAMLVTGAVFLISAIVSIFQQQWYEAAISAIVVPLVLAPMLAEQWTGATIPLSIQVQYGLFLLAGPYLGGYWGLYLAWPPWDTWVHFYSGIFISFAIIVALGNVLHTHNMTLPVWMEMVLLITTKAFIALLWEIGEFTFDVVFDASTQDDNLDTMTDMIAGLGPSLVIAAALYVHRRRRPIAYVETLLNAGAGKP